MQNLLIAAFLYIMKEIRNSLKVQQECPIKSGLLEMKGTCVHPLSREGIRWEPKHTLLHHEVLRQTI